MVSSQTISKWIAFCITRAYEVAQATHPQGVQVHFMRPQAMSMAFLSDVPILDICRVAPWSFVNDFASHHVIIAVSRSEANLLSNKKRLKRTSSRDTMAKLECLKLALMP